MSRVDDELADLRQQNQELTLHNRKLSRELRISRDFLDKVTKTIEAKDMLGRALTAANARQKAYTDILLASCPNIMLLLDNFGRFVFCTDVFLTITGIHNFDMVKNRPYTDVCAPYMHREVLHHLQQAIEATAAGGESAVLTEWIDFALTGQPRCYSIELMPIGERRGGSAGITAGVMAVFADLTDIMREKQRSEAANSAKSDFLATMSHEIRTPMNAIIGMTEIISRSALTEQQKKYLSDIRQASHALLMIINDILDFSKIEAGKLEIFFSGYKLRALLDNLQSIFNVLFSAKKLTLTFEIDEALPDWAFGDESRLRQVLTNLLSNAVKYTSEGGAVFRAGLSGGDRLCFEVTDTGIGIRPEDVSKLFTPFEQLDTRRNRNVVGTGLGLAISYRLCRMMEGNLTVKSVYGEGTTFSVELPYVPAGQAQDAADREEAPKEFSAPGASVLVVDDIDINLTVAEAVLGIFGITPVLSSSGADAISRCRETQFDLIFMDHMMPEMDGLETTELIRMLDDWYARVPIVALTANVVNGAQEMFLRSSFDGYLPKPIELNDLNRCLRSFLPRDMILEA